ncbi:hypothetical protein SAMN04487890_11152 [Mucilaginibacter polytrichastri]|nr:hypothetical protein SAMN04487890_11152 [Mucilaginibacter polytrichastri]
MYKHKRIDMMKKSNYILLIMGAIIMIAGIFVFDQVNIGTFLLSGFIGLLFLTGGVASIAANKKKEEHRLAYSRVRK